MQQTSHRDHEPAARQVFLVEGPVRFTLSIPSPTHAGQRLFLADRAFGAPSTWTDALADALWFRDRAAASRAASRLGLNAARITDEYSARSYAACNRALSHGLPRLPHTFQHQMPMFGN